MVVTFEKRKSDFLGKDDKSSIGGWDKKIKGLCDKLNKTKNYFSLSSCSGRIVLNKNVVKKIPGIFVYRTHELGNFEEIWQILKDYNGKEGLVFKQEPCILHVACRNLESALDLIKKAQESGWKQSGVIGVKDNRVVVDMRGTESISFPIYDKKLLVDKDFVKLVIKESNFKLKKTWDKIKKLQTLV